MTSISSIFARFQNLNLVFLLKALLFPEPARSAPPDPVGAGVLFVTLFYAATAMCCGAPLALRHRLKARREARPAPE